MHDSKTHLGRLIASTLRQNIEDKGLNQKQLAKILHTQYGVKEKTARQVIYEFAKGYINTYLSTKSSRGNKKSLERLAITFFELDIEEDNEVIIMLKNKYPEFKYL